MKQILRIRERYALSKIYSSLLAVLTSMCLYAVKQVSAQGTEPAATAVAEIKPLQIGDTIPEYFWQLPLQVVNHPGSKESITLNDYRNHDLLIFEFWGFSCKGCILSISKLDTLKAKYEDGKVAVLPVHVLPYSFDEAKMLELVGNAAKRNGWSVPSVVKDSLLHTLFSDYLADWGDVWISNGRLLAVPKHGYINSETIAAVLDGGSIRFENRKNVPPVNPFLPLIADGNGAGQILHTTAYSTVTGYIPHERMMRLRMLNREDSTFLYTWNRTLPDLLYDAYKMDISPLLNARTGIIWDADSGLEQQLKWEEDTILTAAERIAAQEAWNAANRYGYQLRLPGRHTEAAVRSIMKRDITAFVETHLGLTLTMEERSKPVLVIHRHANPIK